MGFYRSIRSEFEEGKDPFLQIKRSPRSMLGLLILALISTLGVTLLASFLGELRLPTDLPVLRSLSFEWLYLVPIGLIAEAFRRYHDDLYIFEQDQITHKGGRLSTEYSCPSVRYIDIRAISVSQSFIGLLFDYGDLELNSAAEDTGELVLVGIRAPRDLALIVEEIRALQHGRL